MKNICTFLKGGLLPAALLLAGMTAFTPSAQALDGSVQVLGGWFDAGDSGDTYGYGIRGSLGARGWSADLGFMHYGEGDDIKIDEIDFERDLSGIKLNLWDLGVRYTFPSELYLGGGASYFDFDYDAGSIDGEWGLYGLVGWSFGGEHLRFFIEGMYRYVEGTVKYEDREFSATRDEDIDHDGFGANIGVMYRF